MAYINTDEFRKYLDCEIGGAINIGTEQFISLLDRIDELTKYLKATKNCVDGNVITIREKNTRIKELESLINENKEQHK